MTMNTATAAPARRTTTPATQIVRAIQDQIDQAKAQGADHLMWEYRASYAKFLSTVRVWRVNARAVTVNVHQDAATESIPGLIDRATAEIPGLDGEIVPAPNGFIFTW